jgi:hypothetical protein
MVNNKYVFITLITLAVVITGSTVAWLVFSGHMPKKMQIRAKQVILFTVDHEYLQAKEIPLL